MWKMDRETQSAVERAFQYAINKHGWERTPLNPAMPPGTFLAILGEEFGEVARAHTYDATPSGPDPAMEAAECLQVATMALMRYLALTRWDEKTVHWML